MPPTDFEEVDTAPKTGPTTHTSAILIIHGIGEQQPYQTLDAFARGLSQSLSIEAHQIEHRLTWRDGERLSAVRLPISEALDGGRTDQVDLIEFYWADLVQDRIGLRQVLSWLARTSLTPLLSWSRHPDVLFREGNTPRRRFFVFARELLRAALLVGIAAVVVLPFVYASAESAVVTKAAREVWTTLGSINKPWEFIGWIGLVLFAAMMLRGWIQLARRGVSSLSGSMAATSTEEETSKWWLGASAVAFTILAGSAWVLHVQLDLGVPQLISSLWISVRPAPVLLPVGATLIAVGLRIPLLKFVGDVTLYVTADRRSSFYRTRNEILKGSTNLLRRLLKDPAYETVYVAGHSLGSVIAYDTINRLVSEVRTGDMNDSEKLDRPELERLKGLLTFGSPLDKIYYFFRTEVQEQESIRAQVLSSLHGFRRGPSGRKYGSLVLAEYEIPEPEGFRWYNIYSGSDPVSGFLDFYRVDKQVPRSYWPPLLAHMAYWNDRGFYAEVVEWLGVASDQETPDE